MGQYGKVSSGSFTCDGSSKFIELAYLPSRCRIRNKTATAGTTTNDVIEAEGYATDDAGTAIVTYRTGATTINETEIVTGGFSFIEAGTPQFGPADYSTGSNRVTVGAFPTQVTQGSHGYVVGDVVWINRVLDMYQICGIPYRVMTVVDTNNYTINLDSTNATAFPSDGVNVQSMKVLYPDLYIPYIGFITKVTTGSTTTIIDTTVNHNFVVGQEVKFVVPEQWGMVELDGVRAFVTAVTDAQTFEVGLNSSSFTAFAYPAFSSIDVLPLTPAQVVPVGDANTGYTGPVVPFPVTIPGAFYANTRTGILIGLGNGTQVMMADDDVIEWEAEFPDQLLDE